MTLVRCLALIVSFTNKRLSRVDEQQDEWAVLEVKIDQDQC